MKKLVLAGIAAAMFVSGCGKKPVPRLLERVSFAQKSEVEEACRLEAEKQGLVPSGVIWEAFRSYSWRVDPADDNVLIYRRDWYAGMPVVEFEKVVTGSEETLVYKDIVPEYPAVVCTAIYNPAYRHLVFAGVVA